MHKYKDYGSDYRHDLVIKYVEAIASEQVIKKIRIPRE